MVSVRQSQKEKHATTDTIRENNENLLAGAWWFILSALELRFFVTDGRTPRPPNTAWWVKKSTSSRQNVGSWS